eukprot:gene29760-35935_t
MPWDAVLDESSQQTYYYNTDTGEVSWDLPEGVVISKDTADNQPPVAQITSWREVVDESSGATYYYNEATGDTSWEKPEGFVEQAVESAAQNDSAAVPEHTESEWEEVYDESYGKSYYVNKLTGETSWEKPVDFIAASSHAEANPAVAPPGGTNNESEWMEQLDETSGKVYYYNTLTNEVSWEKPVIAVVETASIVKSSEPAVETKTSEPPALEDNLNMSLFSASTVIPEEPMNALQSPTKNKFAKFINAPDEFSNEFFVSLTDSLRTSGSAPKDHLAQSLTSADAMLTIKELSEYTSLVGKTDAAEHYDAAQQEQELQQVVEILDKLNWEKYKEETWNTSNETIDFLNAATVELANSLLVLPATLHSNLPAVLLVASRLHSTSIFSLYKYALLYFNYDTYLNNNNNILNNLISHQSEMITTSLTKVSNNSVQALACEIFTYIHVFCSQTTRRYDIMTKLLSKVLFHAHAELTDEIYIQICKQIKNNADSNYVEYAYQLMLVLLSCSPPSSVLFPYLLVFLYTQLSSHKGNTNLKRFILHCLQVIYVSMHHTARKELPTEKEIQLLLLNEAYNVSVFQIDLQCVTIAIDSFTSVGTLLEDVLTSLQIQASNRPCFRLFEGVEMSFTLCNPSDRVVDVLSRWEKMDEAQEEGEEKMPRHFLVKLYVHLPITFDSITELLLFKQCIHSVVRAMTPYTLVDYVLLNALYLQHTFGDYVSGKDYVVHYQLYQQHPQYNARCLNQLLDRLMENMSKSELEHRVLQHYKKLMGVNKQNAMFMYINTLQSHKLFGASYFYIINNNINPASGGNGGAVAFSQNEVILAITFKSVVLVDIATNAYLAEYLHSSIYSCTHSFDTFILVIGNKSNNIKYYFKTNQCQEIGDLLNIYAEYHKKREGPLLGSPVVTENSPKLSKRESFTHQMLFNPQTYITLPRDGHNPKQPKLDETRLSMGHDGVLYKMLEPEDWSKYQILSDAELKLEARRSQEVKQNLLTISGKSAYGGTHRHAMKSGFIKLVAPQVGTSSASKRKEAKQWTKDLAKATAGFSTQNMDEKHRATMTLLQQNSDLPQEEVKEDFEFVVDNAPQGDKVSKVFRVIKQKYEQNLHVIDKLYDERMSLEQYARSLEEKLVEVTGKDLEELGLHGNSEAELPPDYEEFENMNANMNATYAAPPSGGGLTAREAAQQLAARPTTAALESPEYSATEPRGRTRTRPPLSASMRSQSLNRSAPAARSLSASRRSLSLGRGVSPQLQ